MRGRESRGRRGFTILEAIAALAIVGIAGTAALAALGGQLRTAERAKRAAIAAALAEERLARIRILPLAELSPLADSLARGAFVEPFAGFRWETTVRGHFGERNLYDVSLRVTDGDVVFTLASRLYRPPPLLPRP